MKYIKNLEESTKSVLNETDELATDLAKLLGIKDEEAINIVGELQFSEYLELANAVDLGDRNAARDILDIVEPQQYAFEDVIDDRGRMCPVCYDGRREGYGSDCPNCGGEGYLEEAPVPGQQLEIGTTVTSSSGESGEVRAFLDKSYLGMRAAKCQYYGTGGDPRYFYIPVDDENKVHPLKEGFRHPEDSIPEQIKSLLAQGKRIVSKLGGASGEIVDIEFEGPFAFAKLQDRDGSIGNIRVDSDPRLDLVGNIDHYALVAKPSEDLEEVGPIVGMAARAAGAAVGNAVANKVMGEEEIDEGFFDMFKREYRDEEVAQWAAAIMREHGRHKTASHIVTLPKGKREWIRDALSRYMQNNPKGEFAPEVSWVVKGVNAAVGMYDDAAMLESDDQLMLDKPTMSLKDIADKHDVSLAELGSQLAMGIQVELEHSNDRKIAKEIALDHLMELPDYYTRLDKMEDEGEADLGEEGVGVGGGAAAVGGEAAGVGTGKQPSKAGLDVAGKGIYEAKAGPFNSPMIGQRVSIKYSEDAWDNPIEPGTEGTITRAERVHTFSRLRPFVIQYTVETDDGQKIDIRREGVRKIKSVEEADNPYAGTDQAMGDEDISMLGRKEVDDLVPGDDIEVVDISGDPTAVNVKTANAPGDTLVVQTDQGEEHIVKKQAVSGTPKIEEYRDMYEQALDEKGKWTRIKNKGKLGDKMKRAERVEKKKKLDHVDEGAYKEYSDKHIALFQQVLQDLGKAEVNYKNAERVLKQNGVSHNVAVKASVDFMDWYENDYSLNEVAPPGQEEWIKKRKPEFKKRYGKDWESVLYATAWKRHNNESIEEGDVVPFPTTVPYEKAWRIMTVDEYYAMRKDLPPHDVDFDQEPGAAYVAIKGNKGWKVEEAGFDLDPPSKHLDDKPFHNPADDKFGARQAMIALVDVMENGLGVDRRKFKKSNRETTVGRRLHLDFGAALAAAGKDATYIDKDDVVAKVEQRMRRAGINVIRVIVKDTSVTVLASKDRPDDWMQVTEGKDEIKPIKKMGYGPKAGSWKRRMHKAQPPENHEKTKKRHKKLREDGWLSGVDDIRQMKPTQKHRPAIWENMLGTVFAMNDNYEVEGFDYNYEAARQFANLDDKQDKRVFRMPRKRMSYRPHWDKSKSEYDRPLMVPRRGVAVLWVEDTNLVKPAPQPIEEAFSNTIFDKVGDHVGTPLGNGTVVEIQPMDDHGHQIVLVKMDKYADHDGDTFKFNAGDLLPPKGDETLSRMRQLAGIKETSSAGGTGAGAVATAPAATGGMVSRDPGIYGKTTEKPKRKKRKTKEEKGDGLGRGRKE